MICIAAAPWPVIWNKNIPGAQKQWPDFAQTRSTNGIPKYEKTRLKWLSFSKIAF